mgnify:CR=1 FL=1
MIKLPKFIRPEFFDIFGVGVFTIITLLSGWSITTKQCIPEWGLLFLFFAGILGIFIDGTIVDKTYLHKEKTSTSDTSVVK